MRPLWTAEEVYQATAGCGSAGWWARGISIDSRTLRRGDLFVALRGPRHDAHDHLAEAFARGAVAAVVSREAEAAGPLVRVRDTLAALEDLARHRRAALDARVVAVTGSVGKTGSKEMLRALLARQAPTYASAKSHNNHWGVPLSLAATPHEVRFAVYELGMNRPGEIRRLVQPVRPHVVLITWIACAHLAFFPDEEAIARAKAEIFEATPPPEIAVLPRDNAHFERLRRLARELGVAEIRSFGSAPDADWRLLEAEWGAEESRLVIAAGDRPIRCRLSLAGRHWAMNAVGVLAAIEALGGDVEAAVAGLAELEAPAGRGRRLRVPVAGGELLLLDESYNANPASMRAALEVLGRQPGRRIAVLGDMAELGPRSPELHAALAAAVVEAEVARVFTCGVFMRELRAALPVERRAAHAASAAELLPALRRELRPGDVVLVKGSLASGMGRIVDALQAACAGAEG